MNILKKITGILCVLIGIGAEYLLVTAVINGTLVKNPDENFIFALTIIPVSVPIVLGLILFGYYGATGEYDRIEGA